MIVAHLGSAAAILRRAGRGIALYGVVAVLLLIGGLKFTAVEIVALENLIPPTPWLAWLYPAFGKAGASYLLGVIEIIAGLLLAVSPWSPVARAAGGLLSSVIFIVTSSRFSPCRSASHRRAVSRPSTALASSWSRTWCFWGLP